MKTDEDREQNMKTDEDREQNDQRKKNERRWVYPLDFNMSYQHEQVIEQNKNQYLQHFLQHIKMFYLRLNSQKEDDRRGSRHTADCPLLAGTSRLSMKSSKGIREQ
ncbi:hypothetical protein NDU88_002010 [Pleurodeles waltl]|uniref:Uncharacterized protein n=1 Tax=Pleurodeles waltl TaxID=8319 RepID=A0AAV7W185_PLEWA|nr:hypothetical protein NDU88_002010 [Pleurodeles waltl]